MFFSRDLLSDRTIDLIVVFIVNENGTNVNENTGECLSFRSSSFDDDTSFGGGNDNAGSTGASANINGIYSKSGSFLFQSSDDTAFLDADADADSDSNDTVVGSGDFIYQC